ncbi:MAG: hypothetical protein AAGH41_10340 [Pseudomonadota bacterium]
MSGSKKTAIAFLYGLAIGIALVIVGDYLGIIDLIDTSEPPIPLFIGIVVLVAMGQILGRTGNSEADK